MTAARRFLAEHRASGSSALSAIAIRLDADSDDESEERVWMGDPRDFPQNGHRYERSKEATGGSWPCYERSKNATNGAKGIATNGARLVDGPVPSRPVDRGSFTWMHMARILSPTVF